MLQLFVQEQYPTHPDSKSQIVTAFTYQLASNKVKILGDRRKVDLLPIKAETN